jgi:hypothetical protein
MAVKTSLTRRLITVASLGTIASLIASACASGGDAETGVGGSAGKSGAAGKDGGAGTAGSSSGGTGGSISTGGTGGTISTGGSGGSSAGGSGGSSTGGQAGGGAGGSPDGSAGMAGGGGLSGGGGEAGADGASGEICNGIDDNGNGDIDEGIPSKPCTDAAKQGVCRTGNTQCDSALRTEICITPQPSSEVCDNQDNNCNGATDEGNLGGAGCDTGLPGICQNGRTQCNGGTIQCVQETQSQPEVCNGIDDNCDGASDENNPGGSTACNVPGAQGICRPGTNQCQSGQLNCIATNVATSETCNNQDDDCNGTIDDPGAVNNLPCTTALPGSCAPGKTQCIAGSPSCQPNVNPGQLPETCDGQDEDCDSTPDDGPPATLCARNCGIATIPNVTTMACTSGTCLITACPAGRKNNNGDYCDGCEATTCVSNPVASTCGAPGQNITLNSSNNLVQQTGQLIAQGEEAWYTVTFTAPPPAQNPQFVPTIDLVSNASGQYVMDVTYGCSPATCPQASAHTGSGSGTGVRTWQMNFNQNPNQCGTAGNSPCTNSSSLPPNIRVGVRRVSVADECASFTIKFSQ